LRVTSEPALSTSPTHWPIDLVWLMFWAREQRKVIVLIDWKHWKGKGLYGTRLNNSIFKKYPSYNKPQINYLDVFINYLLQHYESENLLLLK